MKPAFFALLPFIASVATANPVASALTTKVWERCLVAVGKDHAEVSCAVGYSGIKFHQFPLYISLPAYVPASMKKEEFPAAIRAKLELASGGMAPDPYYQEAAAGDSCPAGMKLVHCDFVFTKASPRPFSIVASYRQPLHDGRFHYLPQFEDGDKTRTATGHSITIFPIADATIRLEAPLSPDDKIMASRITLVPRHNQRITISVK